MFPNLRTARRKGIYFNLDDDEHRLQYFNQIIKVLSHYQWFDEYIPTLSKDVGEELFNLTKGVIDQVIKIYMYMQIDYINAKIKPEINQEYVEMITRKYYPGTFKLNKNKLVSIITYEKGLSTTILFIQLNNS